MSILHTSQEKRRWKKLTRSFQTQDMVATGRALEQYRTMDPQFASTREYALINDLKEAVEAGEEEQFSDKLFQYDQMSPMDKWKTTLMLRVKNAIENEEEDYA